MYPSSDTLRGSGNKPTALISINTEGHHNNGVKRQMNRQVFRQDDRKKPTAKLTHCARVTSECLPLGMLATRLRRDENCRLPLGTDVLIMSGYMSEFTL